MIISDNHKINIPVKKILVVQLGDIGDVVWAIPTFWALKEAFPRAELSVLVRNHNGDFLQDDPHINKILTVNRESAFSGLKLQKSIFREKYDLLFDLRADDRGAFISLFSGVKMRVGLHYSDMKWHNKAFTHLVQSSPVKKKILGAADQSLNVVRGCGIKETTLTPKIFVAETLRDEMSKLLTKERVETKKGWLSVNPFSRWSYKEWSIDKWRQLALFVWQNYKMPMVVTGSAEERNKAETLTADSLSPVHNLAGKTTLREMAALLQLSSLHLGVDSAAPHIAAAVGTPTITIYGPSDWRDWAATGDKNMVVEPDMDCSPCRKKGCEGRGRSKCLDELPVAKVQDAVEKMLKSLERG